MMYQNSSIEFIDQQNIFKYQEEKKLIEDLEPVEAYQGFDDARYRREQQMQQQWELQRN